MPVPLQAAQSNLAQNPVPPIDLAQTPLAGATTLQQPDQTQAQKVISNFNAKPNQSPTPKQVKLPTPQQAQAQQQRQNQQDLSHAQRQLESIQEGASFIGDNLGARINDISITKGLGIAFFVLIFLLWALVPTASGYTRAQLLWFTILGETKLNPVTSVSKGELDSHNPDTAVVPLSSDIVPSQPAASPTSPTVDMSYTMDYTDYNNLNGYGEL